MYGAVAMAAESPARPLDVSKLPKAATAQVDFARDIQPIFASHCLKCHGAEKQKNGLRLDLRAAALKGGDSGRAIVPGESAQSLLIPLVAGLDDDKVMPPKGERLTVEQISLLRGWIDQGAHWPVDVKVARTRSQHWSLQALKMPAVLAIRGSAIAGQSPIDSFITARLATNGLSLSPPADRATLIRRLSFDLIGLPPTPQEIDAFVGSKAPRVYEELVERLLASPRYGERWGRHWLDLARYTESQGFEYDKLRDNAWHYRDYVIKSFNDDKPYGRFMQEQIAGDVLAPVSSDGIVGASLLVCGAWDEAGNSQANATQKAITREEELEDTISVVGQTFLGLTINCARCHSHKFDPIPQEDYYRIKAVFEGVKHGERPIAGPDEVKAREDQVAVLKKEIAVAQEKVSRLESEGWNVAAAKVRGGTNVPGPVPFMRWSFDDRTNAVMPGELKGGAKIANGSLVLPKEGAFYQTAPLSRDIREKTLEAWVSLADLKQGGGAAISIENENDGVFDAIVFGERQSKKWMVGSSGFERTHDLDAPEETASGGTLIHMAVVYRADNSIAVFRNGEPYGKPYTPRSPLQTFTAGQAHVLLGMRHKGGGRPWLTGEIKTAALYDRALSAEEVAASFRAAGFAIPQAEVIASLSEAQRSERETALLRVKNAREALDAIKPLPVSYAGTRIQPSATKRLRRGDVKSPEEVVTPAGLSAIVDLDPEFGLAADAPEAERRLKFAEWLADPRNPLPARVMANRVWHFHFGQGLVATPNDFGVSGAPPTHPELIDWLAVKFIESGWSVKALHRLIVNSATYRQSAAMNAKAAATDADAQLLWRFPPRRLEGEIVRDAMLAASGQINLAAGGPSFRPFDALKFPANAYLPVDKIGSEFNRRSVYRMNVNSGKEPLMDAFDCPDPSVKTPRRSVTTTPLQALGLMNNSFVLRQADHLAERSMNESKGDLPKAVQTAYRLALGRSATEEEAQRASTAARARGLASVCWALLNSTEFVYVR
jgi:mono/diheme cytochrome c family protein